MAKTFPTEALGVNPLNDPVFGYITRRYLEAASQTYPAGSPVKDNASGFIAEWVSVADADIVGFVITAGSDDASAGDSPVDVILAYPQLVIEANFLGSAAADNVLAQTDLFAEKDLIKGTDLLGTGLDGWYFQDAAAGAAVIIQEFDSSPVYHGDTSVHRPVDGDTNARIRAAVKPGVSLWY